MTDLSPRGAGLREMAQMMSQAPRASERAGAVADDGPYLAAQRRTAFGDAAQTAPSAAVMAPPVRGGAPAAGSDAQTHGRPPSEADFLSVAPAQGPIVQRAWIAAEAPELMWDTLRGGLRWFYNTATRTMRFESSQPVPAELSGAAPQSYRAWIDLWKTNHWIGDDKALALSFSNYTQHIVETYPPSEFEYIGIGASCDFVLTYLQRKYGLRSFSIPISGVTNVSMDTEEWGAEAERAVMTYITGFVPTEVIASGKRLLLMDVTSGGNTLFVMGNLLQKVMALLQVKPGMLTRFSLNDTVKPDRDLPVNESRQPFVSLDAVPPHAVEERGLSRTELGRGSVPGGTGAKEGRDFDDDLIKGLQAQKEALKKRVKNPQKDDNKEELEKALKDLRRKLKKAEKGFLVYDPVLYDRMVSDETSIEDLLEGQDWKTEFGRRYEKVDIKDVMKGATNAETEKKRKAPKNKLDETADKFLHDERD